MKERSDTMIPTWFRWLQRDAKLIIEEVDKATNGKLDMDNIIELQWQVGKMGGRIEERVKDLKRKPNPIYAELLNELKKRHYRLGNIIAMQKNQLEARQKRNLVIRCPYQSIVKQEYAMVRKDNVRSN